MGPLFCSVNPQPSGTRPVPKPQKLELMNEQALPSPSTAVKYTVSLEAVGEPFFTSTEALVWVNRVARCP